MNDHNNCFDCVNGVAYGNCKTPCIRCDHKDPSIKYLFILHGRFCAKYCSGYEPKIRIRNDSASVLRDGKTILYNAYAGFDPIEAESIYTTLKNIRDAETPITCPFNFNQKMKITDIAVLYKKRSKDVRAAFYITIEGVIV